MPETLVFLTVAALAAVLAALTVLFAALLFSAAADSLFVLALARGVLAESGADREELLAVAFFSVFYFARCFASAFSETTGSETVFFSVTLLFFTAEVLFVSAFFSSFSGAADFLIFSVSAFTLEAAETF